MKTSAVTNEQLDFAPGVASASDCERVSGNRYFDILPGWHATKFRPVWSADRTSRRHCVRAG
jgi:hypothetical protein